jgi:hypothetical protein
MPSEIASVKASSTWLCGASDPGSARRQHPPPRPDDHHRLLRRVEAVLIQVLLGGQLAPGPNRISTCSSVRWQCRAEMLTTRFGFSGSANRGLPLRRPARARSAERCARSPSGRVGPEQTSFLCGAGVSPAITVVVSIHGRRDACPTFHSVGSAIISFTSAAASRSRHCGSISWSVTSVSIALKVGEVGQARVSELRAVGDDDHLVGGLHHRPLGLDQQEVAVVAAPLVDPGDAEDRPPDVQPREHLVGVGPERNAGLRMDIAAHKIRSALSLEVNRLATGNELVTTCSGRPTSNCASS